MTQYFRITVYHEKENISAIFDSNGIFQKLWQFSSYLLSKGFKIVEVSDESKFLDINLVKVEPDPKSLYLRANQTGKPQTLNYELDGKTTLP